MLFAGNPKGRWQASNLAGLIRKILSWQKKSPLAGGLE
jgi:hypothetical protein